MKIFNVMVNGNKSKMTLAKILKLKAKGRVVEIIDIAEEIDKSYKKIKKSEKIC